MGILIPIFIPTMGSAAPPLILFDPISPSINSSVGTVIGSAVLGGRYSGTPSWSLTANSSGTYSISAATGVVTIASTAKLAGETESITIAISGITPASTRKSFSFLVNTINASTASLNFSINSNSQYIPLLVP